METGNISAHGAELALAPILDIRAATPLHRDILERCGAPLRIDASAVERIGAQCAAILLAAGRQWEADGHALHLDGVSPAMRDGLTVLGIDPSQIAPQASGESDGEAI